MNDAEFDSQRARVQTVVYKWIDLLWLGSWAIDIEYVRDDFDVDGKSAPDTAGCCNAKWQYESAYIKFNMPRILEFSDERLERCVVHELMHVFLNETREEGEGWLNHEERVASMLTRVFVGMKRTCD